MKAETLVAVTGLLLAGWCRADIIAQWNFNDNTRTNNIPASIGSGMASLVGGTRATFAGGVPSDTPDPGTTNFGWNTTAYPTQGTGNKTAGVQFAIDTTGYQDISLRWFLRGSGTASKYVRVQYSLNGADFTDSGGATLPDANNFHAQMNSFVGLGAVENTAGVVLRIVAEWESSATGGGSGGFVTASASAYSPNGTLRFDLVTIEGTPATGNQPPTISAISNQIIRVDTPTDELPFTVGDAETPADELTVSATSSDERVVRNDAIQLGGAGANRTVQVAPDFGQTGAALITLTVTDGSGRTASTSFLVTVLPANTPPRISSIAPVYGRAGETTIPVEFVIADAESAPEDLELAVGSSNPALLPQENIFLGGSGSNRTVSLRPAGGQCGVAVVNVTVSDPLGESTNTSFAVMSVSSPGLIFCDDFSYAEGPVIRVSRGLWRNHSGAIGQMLAGSGRLNVSSAQTEDVNARLAGAPYAFGSGTRLYAKFVLNVSALPATEYGNYFAHFKDDTAAGFTARVFTQTHGAEPGRYRLAIANRTSNATNATQLPLDLSPDTDYTIVIRYDTRTGVSTLWVNPASESDAGITATDEASTLSVSTYAFRQSDSYGQMNIDDLKVATTFGEVLGHPVLSIARTEGGLAISWETAAGAGFRLQGSPALGNDADWQDEPAVPQLEQGRMVARLAAPSAIRFYRLIRNPLAAR